MNQIIFIIFTCIKLKIICWSKRGGIDYIAYLYLNLIIYYHHIISIIQSYHDLLSVSDTALQSP